MLSICLQTFVCFYLVLSFILLFLIFSFFFFFNDTATTEIYTLSLHDALPIFLFFIGSTCQKVTLFFCNTSPEVVDRKSTRLNSSHSQISYAVFCLKKKKKTQHKQHQYTLPTSQTATSSTLIQLSYRSYMTSSQ